MNNFLKKNIDSLLKKVKKSPYFYGFGILFTLAVTPLIIWWTYFIGDNYFIRINTSLGVGDALVFYGSLLAFLGTVSLGALALWQNKKIHDYHLESLQPMLSMKLFSSGPYLYLGITNTGQTVANNIKIKILSIKNNSVIPHINEIIQGNLFNINLELYPTETVQTKVCLNGEHLSNSIFPQIELAVTYSTVGNIEKSFSRTVTFYEEPITGNVNTSTQNIQSDIRTIANAVVRTANYLDGANGLKVEELNILNRSTLKGDIDSLIKNYSIRDTDNESND